MPILLSLGSNLGDREANLRAALQALASTKRVRLQSWSHCYETDPWGVVDQPSFLNMAAGIETDYAPLEFLQLVKDIEKQIGRKATRHWGPRVIDIDLILWNDLQMATPDLSLPHREFRNRAFVLIPLVEVASDAVDPLTGKTVAELAGSSKTEARIEKTTLIAP